MAKLSETTPVQIIRSTARKRTISAEFKDGILVIRAPAVMTDAQLQPHIESFRRKIQNRLARKSKPLSNESLEIIARQANQEFFRGRLAWDSIRYVTNQNRRFGSCSPTAGTIRISSRVANMPLWVVRYVVIHELAHLLEPNHGRQFWALVNRYPLAERARGYLMAVGLEEES